jgi:hypothetical protein
VKAIRERERKIAISQSGHQKAQHRRGNGNEISTASGSERRFLKRLAAGNPLATARRY